MDRRTIGGITEEALILQNYVKSLQAGTTVSWTDIERATGIKMNYRGKQALRRALEKERIIYDKVWAIGIQLGSPKNSMKIISTQLSKIDNSVRRGEKTVDIVREQHYDKMPAAEKKQIVFIGAAFAAIRVAAEQGRKLFANKRPKLVHSSKPELPGR